MALESKTNQKMPSAARRARQRAAKAAAATQRQEKRTRLQTQGRQKLRIVAVEANSLVLNSGSVTTSERSLVRLERRRSERIKLC